MSKKLNLKDKSFGRLTVLKRSTSSKHGKTRWLCRCICGKLETVIGSSLTQGCTESCGCLQIERAKASNYKHGLINTGEYRAWFSMKARCSNPSNTSYKNYGGRGVSVCDRWFNSFENFVQDMGLKPSSLYTLDRIRNNGNYEPKNCRWSTKTEQANNTRRNRNISIGGKTKTLAMWCKGQGLKYDTVWNRISNLGWSIEIALGLEKKQKRLTSIKKCI